MLLILPVLCARLVPRCTYEIATVVGGWGGSCTCPDGRQYWAGDNMDSCGSLACHGGQSGTCFKNDSNVWGQKTVDCDIPEEPPPQVMETTCDVPTVAYSFLIRDDIGLWELWERYFNSCPPGSALPIVHTQTEKPGRRDQLEAQLEPFGGKLIPAEDTRMGNPRFNFLSLSIPWITYRMAANSTALNGCRPQWVHLVTEVDAPVQACSTFHERLSQSPGVSHLDLWLKDGKRFVPTYNVPEYVRPLAHNSHLVTLALTHALSIAQDECDLITKWRSVMKKKQNGWASPTEDWGDFHLWGTKFLGSPDEYLYFTELSQRSLPFTHHGFSVAWWNVSNTSHPDTYNTTASIAYACQRAQENDYFFLRKVEGPFGNTTAAVEAIAGCIPGNLASMKKTTLRDQFKSKARKLGITAHTLHPAIVVH